MVAVGFAGIGDPPMNQVRIARPTEHLREVVLFYETGLGLPRIDEFHDHAGYSGVMLGMPDARYHLEFTEHQDGASCRAPTDDNLLVFYMTDGQAMQRIVERLQQLGYPPVKPANPYWEANGVTIEDPDGWRIVLMHGTYTSDHKSKP